MRTDREIFKIPKISGAIGFEHMCANSAHDQNDLILNFQYNQISYFCVEAFDSKVWSQQNIWYWVNIIGLCLIFVLSTKKLGYTMVLYEKNS